MATAKTKTKKETPAEPKQWDLSPGQYLLFNNDKGDNPKRPDLRGQLCLPDGTNAQISAWKKWTITNDMKLEGSIQVMAGDKSETIGRMKLFTASKNGNATTPVMVGEADVTGQKPMAVTLYKQTSKDGKPYFSGYLNEIKPERIDPLTGADLPLWPEQDDPAQDDYDMDEPA